MNGIRAWLKRVDWARARTYLYGVFTSSMPLLIAYGALNQADAALWVALGGAVFGNGLAAVNARKPK